MDSWYIKSIIYEFMRGSYTQTKFSKRKWLLVKLRSLLQAFFIHFVFPILFFLTVAYGRAVLLGSVAFLVVVLSTITHYSIFLRKVFVLQNNCFRAIVMEMFKFSSNCLMKICGSLKRRNLILKISNSVFQGTDVLLVDFKIETSTNKRFPV